MFLPSPLFNILILLTGIFMREHHSTKDGRVGTLTGEFLRRHFNWLTSRKLYHLLIRQSVNMNRTKIALTFLSEGRLGLADFVFLLNKRSKLFKKFLNFTLSSHVYILRTLQLSIVNSKLKSRVSWYFISEKHLPCTFPYIPVSQCPGLSDALEKVMLSPLNWIRQSWPESDNPITTRMEQPPPT